MNSGYTLQLHADRISVNKLKQYYLKVKVIKQFKLNHY